MPVKKELMLCSLIEGAFNDNVFQALEEFLSDKSEYPPQQCNKPFLNKLDKLAHKEMDKNQFSNISLLLKALQRFCKEDCDDGLNALIKNGLVQKINDAGFQFSLAMMQSFLKRAYDTLASIKKFLKTVELKSNESLVILVEDIFDTIMAICKCNSEGRIQLMDRFLLQIGNGVTDFRLKINIRLEAIRTFNSMLDLIFRKGKIKFHLSEEAQELMLDLAKTIMEVGDYEIQVAISEALCRMSDRKTRETLIYKWFNEPIANAFKEIKDSEFETDCRKFLNRLNASLFNKRRVYTYPCNSAFLDLSELKMPADDKLENFWIDFNLGSRSVTFFIKDDAQDSETDLWETVSLTYEGVKSFAVEEVHGATILIVNLKGMLLVNKKEGKKVKIYFDSAFDVLNTTKLVYGEEKMLQLALPSDESQLNTTDTATRERNLGECSTNEGSELALAVSDGELDRKVSLVQHEEQRCHSDTERDNKSLKKTNKSKSLSPLATSKSRLQISSYTVESKDILPAQGQKIENNEDVHSPDHEGGQTFDKDFTKTSPYQTSAMDIHSLTEVEPELAQNLTVVDTEMETSEKQHNLTAKPERTKSELQSVFDFETSDSAEKSKVSESKRKFLGRRSSQTDEKQTVKVVKASKKRSRSNTVTHKRSDVKKLFTEDSCSEDSEHSWLSGSQVKVLPRVADYSKPKKRKSSVLRVLPLSLESSEGEEQKGEVTQSKGFQITSEEHDIPSSEQVSPVFSDIQTSVVPKVKRIKTADVSVGTNLELLTPPDTLQKTTSPVIKIPRETSTKKIPANEGTPGDVVQQSANSPLTRYYNDTTNMDGGEHNDTTNMDGELEGMEQLAGSSHEMEDGYLNDGNISAALHGFTEGMRQKLRLCYRNMEQYTRQSRQSTEKFSLLMRQIHTYRLQKLSMFESIIDKDLKNLEEDVQTLQNLEEDFNRWKQQSLKLSQFYEKWQQRMNVLMSSAEDKPEVSKWM